MLRTYTKPDMSASTAGGNANYVIGTVYKLACSNRKAASMSSCNARQPCTTGEMKSTRWLKLCYMPHCHATTQCRRFCNMKSWSSDRCHCRDIGCTGHQEQKAVMLTRAVCPVYRSKRVVGKGCRSWGLGNFGTRLWGSTLTLFFLERGHR